MEIYEVIVWSLGITSFIGIELIMYTEKLNYPILMKSLALLTLVCILVLCINNFVKGEKDE